MQNKQNKNEFETEKEIHQHLRLNIIVFVKLVVLIDKPQAKTLN